MKLSWDRFHALKICFTEISKTVQMALDIQEKHTCCSRTLWLHFFGKVVKGHLLLVNIYLTVKFCGFIFVLFV